MSQSQNEKSFPEILPPGWRSRLGEEAEKDYFKKLAEFLVGEYKVDRKIYQQRHWVFRALQMVDYDQVKVVILGQDPYHGEGQAIGLSFGVSNGLTPLPPSLLNIFKELESDLSVKIPRDKCDLTGWAEQG